MRQTYLKQFVKPGDDMEEARKPRGFQGDERMIQEALYCDGRPGTREYPCVIKNLYAPLTEGQVQERLAKARLLGSLRWNDGSAHAAMAEPFAVLPFDYCRMQSSTEYDAAIMPFVGECNLEQVKTNQIKGDPNAAKIELALRSPVVRLKLVRALATILTAAEVRTRLPHLDVVDLNVRVKLMTGGRTLRVYLIDWDDGLGHGHSPEPPNPRVYPWSPDLARAYRSRPWGLDCFALTRYLLWALSGSFDIQMTEQRSAPCRDVAASLAAEASRLSMGRSEPVRRLLRTVTTGVEASRSRVLRPADLPTAAEFLVATRAESNWLTQS